MISSNARFYLKIFNLSDPLGKEIDRKNISIYGDSAREINKHPKCLYELP